MTDRFKRVLEKMETEGLEQIIVTDPIAIYYLIGKKINPGERMLALYLNTDGDKNLVINELFPQEGNLGVDLIWYNDIEDPIDYLAKEIKTMTK